MATRNTSVVAGRTGILLLLLTALATAGDLEPLWSRPLPAWPTATSLRRRADSSEELFLLLPDGRVLVASAESRLAEFATLPAGYSAIAAIPSGSGPALVAAGGPGIVVFDRVGRQLLQQRTRADFDSLRFRTFTTGEAIALVAWRGGATFAVDIGDSIVISELGLPFRPALSLLQDVDADGHAELAATDGASLAVLDFDLGRELVQRWGGVPAPGPARPLIVAGDLHRDTTPELLVLTSPSRGRFDSLRCLDAADATPLWTAEVSGIHAIALVGQRVCVATGGAEDTLALDLLDEFGLPLDRAVDVGVAEFVDLLAIGRRPLLVLRHRLGGLNLRLFAVDLRDERWQSPGYSGVRDLRAFVVRIDRDTFPDLLVLRTSADAGVRLDAFANRTGALNDQLAEVRQLAGRAAAAGDEVALERAVRRSRLLAALAEPPAEGFAATEAVLRERARRRSLLRVVAVFAAAGLLLSVTLFFLVRSRRGRLVRLIEEQALSVRASLAVDLIAVDHNFLSKGNWPAAAARLRELRGAYGLDSDCDLARIDRDIEPWYSNAVGRLIERTPTEPLLELVTATVARAGRPPGGPAAGGGWPPVLELGRSELTRPLPAGASVIIVRNREYPDVYQQLRILSSPTLRSALEHIIVDHFSYAASRACVLLDYTVSTHWNRRLTIRLFSDSPDRIDLTRRDGHLVSQLMELQSVLRPAVEVPGPGWHPARLGALEEKLWVGFADLVSVLTETRARLRPANADDLQRG